jgi:TatA/E family protein of Tat protein translocase
MSVGPAEILIILVVALLVFGPQRLPEVGRQVGSALRELRRMQDTVRGELDMVLHPEHGTSSSSVPAVEPDDHSAIDHSTIDHSTIDGASVDGTAIPVDPPPDGHSAGDGSTGDAGVDDPGFSGPDSFI